MKLLDTLLHTIFSQDIKVLLCDDRNTINIKTTVTRPLAILAEFSRVFVVEDLMNVFMEILAQFQIIEKYYDLLISTGNKMIFKSDLIFENIRLGLFTRIQISTLFFFSKEDFDSSVISEFKQLLDSKVCKQIYARKYE